MRKHASGGAAPAADELLLERSSQAEETNQYRWSTQVRQALDDRSSQAEETNQHRWSTQARQALDDRLRMFECIVRNCRNAIEYQHNLDLSREWQVQRPFEIGGLKTIPEWIAIRKVAHAEIDNTNLLIELLASGKPDLIDRAATETETDIRVLDHALVGSLRRKVKIVIAHWEDYERLFTTYDDEQRNRSSDAWDASVHP